MSNTVNRGQQPNDQQADTLYEAFGKVNEKFSEHDDLKQVQDASEKETPVDADSLPLIDSSAEVDTPKLKWLSWVKIKATLKVYFDTLYNNLGLGETDTTAYRGDRGKTGYDHSQTEHAPSNATAAGETGDAHAVTAHAPSNATAAGATGDAHAATAHAPSNAQKNSDITKAEIEDKLIGEITTHTHADGDVYEHPIGFTNQPGTVLANAAVISQVAVNNEGHVSAVSTRNLTAANVGAAASSHTHGAISNIGAVPVGVTVGLSDRILITDSSDSHKVKQGPTFSGSNTEYLRRDGTWVVPPNTRYDEISEDEINNSTGSLLRSITGRRATYMINKCAPVSHTHNYEAPLNDDQKRKITFGTDDPTGGSDNDIYLQYE